MKKLIAFAGMGLLLAISAPSFSGEQQEKMKVCNKEAADKALKGDERKVFMKNCLSKKPEAPVDKKTTQQDKMKNCNKEASDKALKGDERKKFMSSCLKG